MSLDSRSRTISPETPRLATAGRSGDDLPIADFDRKEHAYDLTMSGVYSK
jgi:hypothetical protein